MVVLFLTSPVCSLAAAVSLSQGSVRVRLAIKGLLVSLETAVVAAVAFADCCWANRVQLPVTSKAIDPQS